MIDKLWDEIFTHYTESHRHYHNLTHLEDLLMHLMDVKENIENWNIILFTLFYHDIIYNSLRKDNEDNSAKLALERLREVGISENERKICYQQIIATKSHQETIHSDTNYFIDSDLSILGRASYIYEEYCENIRKEYSIYPTFLYRKGRKKVVNHILSMKRIFKTDYFFEHYEKQARKNLLHELNSLG